MQMQTHELHPSLVHAPLTLLPAAAIADLLAAATRSRATDRMGRVLWWATAATGLGAGLAGMAASQEIDLPDDHARDMMFIHGLGNATLVASALGVALLRTRRPAAITTGLAGLVAAGAAVYMAYLGGALVYGHGAGVKAMGPGNARSPALFSRAAPGRLARDAGRGMSWLARRAMRAFSGREKIDRTALGAIAEVETTQLSTTLVTPPTH